MKIAIPVVNGKLCMHFGHCEQFALMDVNEDTKQLGEVQWQTPPAHEPGVLPRWLHQLGVEVVIAGGMGVRAQTLLAEKGIKVMVGAGAEGPEALAEAFVNGTLQRGANTCSH